MDLATLGSLISSLGFPIVCCIGLAVFCKFLVENSNKTTDRIFNMFEQSNKDNREAIENNTKVLEKVCDKLDKLDNK